MIIFTGKTCVIIQYLLNSDLYLYLSSFVFIKCVWYKLAFLERGVIVKGQISGLETTNEMLKSESGDRMF